MGISLLTFSVDSHQRKDLVGIQSKIVRIFFQNSYTNSLRNDTKVICCIVDICCEDRSCFEI
ncbi:14382_t:CDS:2, partial [Funneliformis caledonium]